MPKLWQQAIGALLAVLLVSLVPLTSVFADTRPYFTTQNGGPFVGGQFSAGGSCSTNYQRPTFPTATSVSNIYNGAIMAWANSNRSQSARSSLDAFATGVIEGNGGSSYGFYTGLSSTSALSFANFENFGNLGNPPFWGGIFEGANLGNAHCIPDYFGTKQNSPVAWTGNFTAISPTNQFSWGGGNLSGTVPVDKTVIIFASGSVNITGNITYSGGYNINNVPKFALVVRGDIRISPNVSRLDGWYIAQPSGAIGGVIWTCNNSSATISDSFIRSNCNSRLTINGALTAKQINLSRISGNLGSNSAEDVDFSPEMILGGPFFEDSASSDTTGVIQSLISLPPVF